MISMLESTLSNTLNVRDAAGQVSRPVVELSGKPGPSVNAVGISRTFETNSRAIEAIRDVNLTVEPGEFCVIVGPSGCGKTTFLRILAGLERPTSGDLSLQGPGAKPPTNAMVFQGRSVFPWLSVRENVAYGLKLNGAGKRERRRITESMLELVGLSR